MHAQRRLLLTAWLCLAACSDDVPSQGGESSTGVAESGTTTADPVTATTGSTATSVTESADTTMGDTTMGDTSTGDTSTGDTTAGDTTTGDTTMAPGVCGDGIVDMDEACDDAGESATCNADCSESACTDGVLNATALEACDDGNLADFDFCTNACTTAPVATLDAMHVLDTDTGTLDGVPLLHWDAATSTWYLSGLELTGSLTVVGANSLTLEVDGDVVIAGTLDVSGADGGDPTGPSCGGAGAGGIAGPGGYAGGDGAGYGGTGTEDGAPGQGPGLAPAAGGTSSTVLDDMFGAGGGGGGGHVMPGLDGMGHGGGVGGEGGELHASLPPLVGGGGGGGGGVEKDGTLAGLAFTDDEGTGGGGGGGAVAIHSTTAITVTGTIDASGGDGGSDLGCPENPGFGGGGAGGSIAIVSPASDVAMGLLDVSGGQGGLPTFNEGLALYGGGDGADGHVSRSEALLPDPDPDPDPDETDSGEASECELSESFEGLPDGSDWPAPWVALGGVMLADVQGGRGRLLPVTGPQALARMHVPLPPECVDVEGTLTFELADGQTSGLGLYLRHNEGFLTETDPPGRGYVAFAQAFGLGTGLSLWREVDGVETILAPLTPQLIMPGIVHVLRFRVTQEGADTTRLQARVWPLEQVEPAGWHVNLTDGSPSLQGVGGGVVIDVWSQLEAGTAFDVLVDDIVVGPVP